MPRRKPPSRAVTRRSFRLLWQHDYRFFCKQLVAARVAAGMTQREAAERLGRPHSFVANSETGERRVDIIELLRFARLYRKRLSYFVPG